MRWRFRIPLPETRYTWPGALFANWRGFGIVVERDMVVLDAWAGGHYAYLTRLSTLYAIGGSDGRFWRWRPFKYQEDF